SSKLKEKSLPELDKILRFLQQDTATKIRIIGHTDLTGDLNFNQGLSERRAKAVKDYFISKGIEAGRIKTQGKGSSEPLFQSKKPEHNKLNRRTEFEIME
ncbi:MAG: OmpA family protein, partial [Spirochaetota bacterium]